MLFGAALVLAIGATAIGWSLDSPAPRLVGADAPINLEAGERLEMTAHNSPTLVQNPVVPANLVVVNRVDAPLFSCALHVSADGGSTWTQPPLPVPDGEESRPRCFNPDAAFGPDGTLYISFVTLKGLGSVPNAVWIIRSTDGGRSLSAPQRILGPLAFQLRLAADAQQAGRLHLSWLQAADTATLGFPSTDNPILYARSEDGGTTWSTPARVSPPTRSRVLAPSTALGPGGELYLLYLDVRNDRLDYSGAHEGRGGEPDPGPWTLVLARSLDGGATWRESEVADDIVPIDRFVALLPPAPSLAIDPRTGRVFVAFHDARQGDADVLVWSSGDGGSSFDAPRRVNDTRMRDGTSQYLPKVAVSPGGRLDVVYYDRRADTGNRANEVSLQSSTDGGRSFSPRVWLSGTAFDSWAGIGRNNGLPDLGSRLALVSTRGRALAVWPDTRAAVTGFVKQDLGSAAVEFPSSSGARSALRIGGPALGAAALALLGWWFIGVRRSA